MTHQTGHLEQSLCHQLALPLAALGWHPKRGLSTPLLLLLQTPVIGLACRHRLRRPPPARAWLAEACLYPNARWQSHGYQLPRIPTFASRQSTHAHRSERGRAFRVLPHTAPNTDPAAVVGLRSVPLQERPCSTAIRSRSTNSARCTTRDASLQVWVGRSGRPRRAA